MMPIANQQLIFDEYRFIWSGIFYVEKLNGKNKQGMIFLRKKLCTVYTVTFTYNKK